ncbi:MAG TPA: class I SAM-dependent methyltransferase [Pseudogracilibacillus sp.]|nr:class I SAM-dependent methyltransferase [Pseudogracilibacillus sp.]
MSKEHWNDSFSDTEYVYGEAPNQFIQEKAHLFSKQAHIACFAEGEGRNAVYLATKGHTITSYDQSEIGLKKTQELAAKNQVNVETREADLTTEKVEANKYDGAIMVFGHVPRENQAFLFQSILDSVKTGGVILIEVYSENQLAYKTGGPPIREMLYRPTDLLEWTQEQHPIHFYYGESERHEGKRHNGTCHIIQLAITKQ